LFLCINTRAGLRHVEDVQPNTLRVCHFVSCKEILQSIDWIVFHYATLPVALDPLWELTVSP